MTGFGDASAEIGGVHYFLEVRSLNSRYFKAIIRLPEELQGLEAEMEAELRRRLRRGSVVMSATYTDASESAALNVNHRALSRYIEQLERSPRVGSGAVSIDLGALLTLPGVLQPAGNEEQRLGSARGAFLSLLDKACANVNAMREREGASLLEDLLEQRDLVAARLEVIAQRSPQVLIEYEGRLKTRIETMLREAGLAVEPGDVVREIAIYAEKSDIAEEICRLKGHLEQFTELTGGDGSKGAGRTLDFLAQEMLREANTIASKCGDSMISRCIVEIKGAIDRIKEQVQNAE